MRGAKLMKDVKGGGDVEARCEYGVLCDVEVA